MSIGLMLYLANVSDKLGNVMNAAGILLMAAFIVITIWNITTRYEYSDKKTRLKLDNTYSNNFENPADAIKISEIKLEEANDAIKLSNTWFKTVSISLTIAIFLKVALPSSKDLYIIYGAGVAEDIVKSPKVQETGGKILDLINSKLEEMKKGSDE